MSEQISPNANSNERDYGPFTNGGNDDISHGMEGVIEELKTMQFPQDDDAVSTNEAKPEQSQASLPSDEQIKH